MPGSLGLDLDEERRTERYLWRRASALCELSILEYLRGRPRGRYRVGFPSLAACLALEKHKHDLCCARLRTELKHISKSRNINQNEIPPVAASEQGEARPEFKLWACYVAGAKCGRIRRDTRCNSGGPLTRAGVVVLFESIV